MPEKTLELDCSTGVLMPLYDPDTNMLFLAGKGDTTIAYMEVTDKEPHLIDGLRHNGRANLFDIIRSFRSILIKQILINKQANKRKVLVWCRNALYA